MTRRLLLGLVLVVAGAQVAEAQIIRSGIRTSPIAWTSLSIGWMQQGGFCDPDSSACWDFGNAPQWRATLEFPVGTGATIGAVGTIARVPLIYSSSGLSPNSCVRCDADANVSQIMGLLRIGGGSGFHQVIDLSAGVSLFSNFRRSDDGSRLGPGEMTQAFTFALGYGFGYNLSPRTQVMLVQDYGLVIHKRQSGSADNTAQQATLRLGVRMGLGDR